MEDIDLLKYIYIEYSIAVLLVTDLIKMLIKNINTKFVQFIAVEQPKYLTLIVATILGVVDWIVFSGLDNFHLWQKVISFAVAVLGYDYAWKLVKDAYQSFRNPSTP
jgi:predicted Zn-dependent protease